MKKEEFHRKKIPLALRKNTFPAERNALYTLILHSLAEYRKIRSVPARIAELNRHAELLHDKGLKSHARSLLSKAKKIGQKQQDLGSVLRCLDIEQEMARTGTSAIPLLEAARESLKTLEDLKLSMTWKEFYLRVHMLCIDHRSVPNPEVREVLQSMIRIQPERSLFTWPFYAKLYHAFAFSDYFVLINDAWNSSIHLRAALEQLLAHPEIAEKQPGLLLGTSSGLFSTLLTLREYEQVLDLSSRLRSLAKNIFKEGDKALRIQLFSDTEPYELEALTRLKRLDDAAHLASGIEERLKGFASEVEPSNLFIVYRALSKTYYAMGEWQKAFDFMHRVFSDDAGRYSPENIYYLVLFYELKKFEELPDVVARMRRQLINQKRLHKAEFILMELFMKLSRTSIIRDHRFFFEEALHDLSEPSLEHDNNFQSSIAVFDFREWIKRKC